MSCSTHNTCQLYFPIPRNGKEKKFIIFFNPYSNEQKPVIRCEMSQDDYKCSKVPGFGWGKLNSTHGLITLPQHIAAESGSFRSQVQGQNERGSWRCSWSPVDSCSPPNLRIRSEPDFSTTPLGRNTFSPQSENDDKEDNHALYIGVFAGVALLVAIILMCVIMLFKKGAQLSNAEKMMEKGQETVISDGKKSLIDGYTKKDSGMDPVKPSGEWQNLLTEAPSEKKVSDFSFTPCESTGIPDIRIDGHSSEGEDQVKPSPPSVEVSGYARQRSSGSDSSTGSNESTTPLLKS